MKQVFIFVLILSVIYATAQEKTIRGFVIDDYTSYKIQGVQVSPDAYDTITSSNENGKFRIDVPPKFKDTIVFS